LTGRLPSEKVPFSGEGFLGFSEIGTGLVIRCGWRGEITRYQGVIIIIISRFV